jgi:cytochrome c biogenesis protein CcmG, thiol:disulfide interchange protein DsbE
LGAVFGPPLFRPAGWYAGQVKQRSLLVVPILLLSLACARAEAPAGGADGNVPEGAHADFRLPTLDGDELGPPDFEGQVVVVDFWATWCGPCHKQAEEIAKVFEDYEGEVQFLAVDLGESEKTVREFVAKNPFGYPVLLDPEEDVTMDLGIYGLPTVMIVDTKGEVTYFKTGILYADALRREIEAAGAA